MIMEQYAMQSVHALWQLRMRQTILIREESQYFVDRTFDGSLPSFVAAFLGGKKISGEDAKKLKKMIDEHKEA